MKKTALTLGLFSLIMVATSFANPVVTNSSDSKNTAMIIDIDLGGQSGRDGTRKLDVYNSSNQLNAASSQLNSFSSDSQAVRSTIKVD
ncbi:hypothetical protein [Flavobacterium sp. MDT1-60]|uniref:hypothetical protein n=1 Tax=Flavobacterium sp. MDT1-60 TaxID=1979344 RepID=UPI001786FAF0|nr:hypothetical protein [Flavobacterium sp. MDT1-60]QOG03337.1 hypothetical protein IHE43_03590 [Flavobacterium sp. MDT1-60]